MITYLLNFNSIKVRLKPKIGSSGYSAKIFQFHKGTIKTFPDNVQDFDQLISIP